MISIHPPHIKHWEIAHKRVFLRTDFNIPLDGKRIVNDFRLQQGLQTLLYLIEKGATVYVVTHIAKPISPDPRFSTAVLIDWFLERGFSPIFVQDPIKKQSLPLLDLQEKKSFYLFENIRFYKEETSVDLCLDIRINFAKQIMHDADFYINDALSVSHRDHTTVTILPTLFCKSKRSLGFGCYHEIEALQRIASNTNSPSAFIIGGAKLNDKIHLIDLLGEKINFLLLCPAIIHPFLKARGFEIGLSLNTMDAYSTAMHILQKNNQHTKIIWPVDYLIQPNNQHDTYVLKDPLCITQTDTIISIGPKTITVFDNILSSANTIFLNGICGFIEKPKTMPYMNELFKKITEKKSCRIACGGDSIAALTEIGLQKKFDFLLSGGGATLAFLSGKTMPGLTCFIV